VAKKAKKAKAPRSKAQAVVPQEQDLIGDMVDALVAIGGEGTAQVLGSDEAAIKIKGVISTQCSPLDKAIGRGGIPLGRLSILHGPEMSGKTTIALHIVAETQRRGGIVIYLDKEYKLDPDYARAIGVDTMRLIISQPDHLERIYELIDGSVDLARKWREQAGTQVPVLVVLDSINSAISKAEFEGSFEDKHVAAQARVHSQQLPKVIPRVSKENVALLFIAQDRTSIGKMFGDPVELAGGKAVRYYASLIMQVKNIGAVKESGDGDKVAQRTRVECRKNQIAMPFKRAEFEIRHGVGVDRIAGLLDQAIDLKVITNTISDKTGKRTTWFQHRERPFANGRAQAWEQLSEDDELRMEVMEDIAEVLKDDGND
jgi:recombination protein RecA